MNPLIGHSKYKLWRNTVNGITLFILLLYGLFIFFPMYWMLLTAIKGPAIAMRFPPELLPTEVTLVNFTFVFERTSILRWIWNTLFVSTTVTAFYVIFCGMSGYAFAQKRFPGQQFLFWLIISTLMLPYFSYLIPLYITVVDMGFFNTYAGLILPMLSGPFGVFLMKQYMTSFPRELMQAAKVDGCGEFQGFWRIVVPVCKPAFAFLGIVIFIAQWNNFLWPLLIVNSDQLRMLQVGIALFQQKSMTITDYGAIMASSTIASLPIIILFLVFQRHIISGITIGAIKG